MDLNARVDINFARVDVNFHTITVSLILSYFFFHFDTNQHQGPTNTQKIFFSQIYLAVLVKWT